MQQPAAWVIGIVLVGSLLVGAPAAAQTVDDILAANLRARGGQAAISAVQSVRQTSLLDMQGGSATVVVVARRPNLLR